MILNLFETSASMPNPGPSGSASSVGVLNAKSAKSFKSAINGAIGQTKTAEAPSPNTAFDKLAAQLSEILQSLENIDPKAGPASQIQATIDQITSALAEFEASTGLDLVDTLQGFYVPSLDPASGEIPIQLEEDVLSAQTSNLIAFIGLLTGATETPQGSSDFSKNIRKAVPNTQAILAQATSERPSAIPQITPAAVANDIPEPARAGAQAGTLALTAASANLEETAAAPQAITQVKAAMRITPTAETKTSSSADMQIAMSLGQRNSDPGLGGGEQFKKTFEFVSNVANSQLTLQNPAFGVLSVIEPRFADLLPLERQMWASPASIDQANAAQGNDAPAAKGSRFTAAIIDQIRAANVTDGQTKIELSPRGLGNIEIEVTTDADGGTNVVVRADNNVVLNALREMRDPWAQITGIENGSTFSFEDMSSQQDDNGGSGTGDTSDDGAMPSYDVGPATDLATAAIIDGDQLDLMT